MKKIITILFLATCFTASARNFYFSSVSGVDSRTSTEAQSSSTPWQTLSKLNSFFSSLLPGDSVLLKRGEFFYGTININHNGSIVIGAYGTGSKPVITSLVSLTGWTQNAGTNIWTSAANTSLGSKVNIVLQNNSQLPIGRYPNLNTSNKGYLMFESSTSTSINDNELTTATNWAGAKICVRVRDYTTNVRTVLSHVGNNLTVSRAFESSPGVSTTPIPVHGYFFQDDIRTLDQQGEWYYNPSTKKISIYSTTMPTGIQAASLSTLMEVGTFTNIKVRNISFQGANDTSIQVGSGGSGFDIQNCSISFSQMAISAISHASLTVKYDSIIYQTGQGIFANNCSSHMISYNVFKNIDQVQGMGLDGKGIGIFAKLTGTISYNEFRNIGYVPIFFDGTDANISNNFIDSFCNVQNDGGGIYYVPTVTRTGQKITNNIILHAIGAGEGTPYPTFRLAFGIYLDNNASDIEVTGNTVAFCDAGMYLHRGNSHVIRNNTLYDNNSEITIKSDNTSQLIRSLVITKNIFFAKNANNKLSYLTTINSDLKLFATRFDSNYYCRPILEPANINNAPSITTGGVIQTTNSSGFFSLDQFMTSFSPYELHGKKTPKGYDSLRFEINPSANSITVPLNGYTWLDGKGTRYKTQLTLAPYTSVVLIRDTIVPVTSNVLPVANAGSNQVITLPVSTVTLSGSGTDADGTISAYLWTQTSGTSATITSAASATTTITGLTAGTRVFQIRVTDNSGGQATSTVQVIVNAAPANIIPVSNAGVNQVITLPVSGVTLSGSGTDADGTISGYLWSKYSYTGSGSGAATVTSTSSASTSVSGLVAGTYIFQLRVTDNSGAFGYDTMQVKVNPAPPVNIAPTVTIGADQTITLPTNSVTLVGTGSDADGTVTGYGWTQTSALAGTITTPSASTTTITGMVAGTYTFKVTVTDNSGATGFATTIITVNPFVNTRPVAIAGTDSTISLPNGITLNGSGSYDADGPLAGYLWTKLSGPAYTIDDAALANPTLSGLSGGTYVFRLTVTDANGATAYDDIILTVNSTSLSITVTATPIACFGGTGTIVIGASGGIAPYTGAVGTHTVSTGTYTYIIGDANGAADTAIVSMSQPTAIVLDTLIGTITVYGETTTATITPSGGTAPYQYSINNSSWTTSNVFTIAAGSFTVTVMDYNGCTSSISFTVTQPAGPTQHIKKHRHIYY